MDPLIVSYYTPLYMGEADRLIASCRAFGYDHLVMGIGCAGTWRKNCGIKPAFLYRLLGVFPRDLLWLDADAEIVRPLPPMPEDALIATRIMQGHPCGATPSGTIFLRDSTVTKQILMDWMHEDRIHPELTLAQKALEIVWKKPEWSRHFGDLRKIWRPFDEPDRGEPIVQHQASRRLKQFVGR